MSMSFYSIIDGCVIPLNYDPFPLEESLQDMVLQNPAIVKLHSDANEYRLFLVRKEHPVKATNTSYWLDILFVDSNAVPVIVETKLGVNHEIHRIVAAQILDYAANLVSIPISTIKEEIKTNLPTGVPDPCHDRFLAQLESNINQNRMRLIIVSDSIPGSLERIILFMNGAMPAITCYGIEIKRMKIENNSAGVLAKRVVGMMPSAKISSQKATYNWTIEAILEKMESMDSKDKVDVLVGLIKEMEQRGFSATPGMGITELSIAFKKQKDTFVSTSFNVKTKTCLVWIYQKSFIEQCSDFVDYNDIMGFLIDKGFHRDAVNSFTANYLTFNINHLTDKSNEKAFFDLVDMV